MTEALTVEQLRDDFERCKRLDLTRPRFRIEEIATLFAEIDRLRADLAQAMAERGRALTVADALEQAAERAADAERERIAQHFDSRDKGAGGFYDPHEPAEIIRALGPA